MLCTLCGGHLLQGVTLALVSAGVVAAPCTQCYCLHHSNTGQRVECEDEKHTAHWDPASGNKVTIKDEKGETVGEIALR